MTRHTVTSPNAPAAVGPYSQAVVCGNWVFCSGQIPLDPLSGEMCPGDLAAQTRRVLENLSAVLQAAGASLADVVKTTVFMIDLTEFKAMNEVYARFFTEAPPARSTVQVAALPRGARIEIEAVARLRRPGP